MASISKDNKAWFDSTAGYSDIDDNPMESPHMTTATQTPPLSLSPTSRQILVNLICAKPYHTGLPHSTGNGRHGVRASLLAIYALGLVRPNDRGWEITEAGVEAIRREMASA